VRRDDPQDGGMLAGGARGGPQGAPARRPAAACGVAGGVHRRRGGHHGAARAERGMTGYDTLAARWDAAVMPTYGTPPVALARGEGCRVWDVDGREYLDLIAGIAVSCLGHGHPALVEAVCRQVQALAHTSNLAMHEPGVRLAERLLALLGGAGRVFLC